eukprot:4715269-Lingulodinium_polyedra.AAC.1
MRGNAPFGPDPYNHNCPVPVSTKTVEERGRMLSTPTDSVASIEQHPEAGVGQTIVQVENP